MDMAGKDKKPEIRFTGFTNDWEQHKLGTLVELNPKAELPETFEYVDLESVVGTEMITHREERKVTAPSRAQRLARQGDLFYQTVRPYQKNNYLFEKPCNNYVFSTGYAQMRPHGDGYFLLSLVQNNGFVKSVLDRCTGTSYPAINSNELADMEVYIPIKNKNNEQVKIGTFFKNLDNLITLHQRKYDKLVIVKKSMLEKMFPKDRANVPEIRFSGFTDAWEQRELGEVLTERKILQKTSDDAPVLAFAAGQGVIDRSERKSNNRDHLTLDPTNKIYLLTEYNDIVYNPSNLKYGAIDRNKHGKGVISPIYVTFTTEEEPSFIELIVKSEKFKLRALQFEEGTVVKRQSVKPENLLTLDVKISPSRDEQKKIGALFEHLDKLITLHQRELEKLKNIKKSLLEKMFVSEV